MKLIKPSFEILSKIDRNEILTSIELAGRTCYKSEDKITEDSASKFVEMIINRGHLSVIEHKSISVKFICDRGVSHELVRHRIASFSQESTRYCNYGKDEHIQFIIPSWLDLQESIIDLEYLNTLGPTNKGIRWILSMYQAEDNYLYLLNIEHWSPQQARAVLPNSLKTEIVVTANLREWKEIFKQRCSSAAHPQMRELMIPLQEEFHKVLPEIF